MRPDAMHPVEVDQAPRRRLLQLLHAEWQTVERLHREMAPEPPGDWWSDEQERRYLKQLEWFKVAKREMVALGEAEERGDSIRLTTKGLAVRITVLNQRSV